MRVVARHLKLVDSMLLLTRRCMTRCLTKLSFLKGESIMISLVGAVVVMTLSRVGVLLINRLS